MNSHSLDSYESAIVYCRVYQPTALNVRGNNTGDDFFDLDEEDIEYIQEILDESDDDEDVDVEMLSDDEHVFPMPKKLTQKELM